MRLISISKLYCNELICTPRRRSVSSASINYLVTLLLYEVEHSREVRVIKCARKLLYIIIKIQLLRRWVIKLIDDLYLTNKYLLIILLLYTKPNRLGTSKWLSFNYRSRDDTQNIIVLDVLI